MRTAGSGPESPSTAIFATLPATASGHPGNLGYNVTRINPGADERWFCSEAQAKAAGWRKALR